MTRRMFYAIVRTEERSMIWKEDFRSHPIKMIKNCIGICKSKNLGLKEKLYWIRMGVEAEFGLLYHEIKDAFNYFFRPDKF